MSTPAAFTFGQSPFGTGALGGQQVSQSTASGVAAVANAPSSISSSLQYLRQFSCIVADASGSGIEFSQFKCSFIVRRGDLNTPNSADVRIYNLSDETANTIGGHEFTQLQLQAGYSGSFGLIFRGTILQVRKGRIDQRDSYVDITAADGDEAYNFATVFVSLKAGTPPGGVAEALLNSMQAIKGSKQQISAGYAPNWPTNGCIRGKVLSGLCRDQVRKFSWVNAVKPSIQDGAQTYVPYTSFVPAPVPVISPSTGLIGVPEQTQAGIHMRTLLNPNLKVGQLVRLNSKNLNQFRYGLDLASAALNPFVAGVIKTNADGLYYIMAANHSGDTRSQDWYTDINCLSADATLTAEAANALTAIGPPVITRYD